MENIGAILGDLDLGYADIVKTTIFLADMDDFAAVNEVYGEYVGDAKPARSTVPGCGAAAGRAGRDRGHRGPLAFSAPHWLSGGPPVNRDAYPLRTRSFSTRTPVLYVGGWMEPSGDRR